VAAQDWRRDVAVPEVTADHCAAALQTVRRDPPLVQCLTNIVATGWTANALLAVGAAPAMVDNPEEAADLATVVRGVLVNLGAPYPASARAVVEAVGSADRARAPWALDPVAAGGLA
jgi:hydroxyethylthiazole kinase